GEDDKIIYTLEPVPEIIKRMGFTNNACIDKTVDHKKYIVYDQQLEFPLMFYNRNMWIRGIICDKGNNMAYPFLIAQLAVSCVILAVIFGIILMERKHYLFQLKKATAYFLHEIKNPVSVIGLQSGYLLRYEQNTNEGYKGLEMIEKQLQLIKSNCSLLSSLSQSGTERITDSFSHFYLSEICSEVIENLDEEANNKVVVTVYEETPVFANRELIKIQIRNIILNSIKHSGCSGKVCVKIYKIKDRLCISISDTGIGIPYKNKKTIVSAFRKGLDNKKDQGTGLSLIYDIAAFHNTDIEINTEEGKGCEFILRFK
ncbi:MAG: HAMP domain-containing histidine kinase, partial [Lachnospiraceae bacterium]|nr:HAMP domain-containing histidine kinase [Lachnospiraceae bacterium]